MRRMPLAIFAMLSLIWGSEWIAVRQIDAPPMRALAIRYGIAALVLGAVMAARRIRLPDLSRLLVAAVTGVTLLALPAVLTSWGGERLSPGLLVVILAMTPLIAALLEGRASGSLLAASVAGVGGTALLASRGLSFDAIQLAGAAAVLAAAVSVAASVVYLKRSLIELRPLAIAVVQLAAAATILGIASIAMEGTAPAEWTMQSVFFETVVAVAGLAVAWPLYYWLLRRMDSFQLTALQWPITAVALVESLILLRGMPSWRILAGVAIVLLSLRAVLRVKPGDDAPLTIEVTFRSIGG